MSSEYLTCVLNIPCSPRYAFCQIHKAKPGETFKSKPRILRLSRSYTFTFTRIIKDCHYLIPVAPVLPITEFPYAHPQDLHDC